MLPCDHNPAPARPVVSALGARLMLAALCLAPAAQALDSGDIVVTRVQGEVHVTMNGGERELRAGAVLELPASVRTGPDGALDLRQGATTVKVGPDTQLDFPALEIAGGPIDRVQQSRGNVFYDVGKRGTRKLRIETPFLVAVVKGTQFNVAAREDATTIALFEGSLEIRSTQDGDIVDLLAGEIASRHRSETAIGVIKMDATRVPTAPAAPSGAATREPAAAPGTPRENSPAASDEYLVQSPVDDAQGATDTVALADARIDLSGTDNLPVALVNVDIPPVVEAEAPPLVDAGPVPDPGGAGSVGDVVPDAPSSDAGTGAGDVMVDAGASGGPVGDVDTGVPAGGSDASDDVDLGIDLDGEDSSNSGHGNSGHGSDDNGNAYGHDKDNAQGEANGHDDTGLLRGLVEDIVNLLDDSLRRPSRQ